MRATFSFDAETNGLYGQAFMVAGIIIGSEGVVDKIVLRCPIEGQVDQWVAQNVLPHIADVAITHQSYEDMLNAFYRFYVKYKMDTKLVAHVAYPVEAKLLRDMIELDLPNRQWQGPFPLIDVASTLDALGYDPTTVDSYNHIQGISVPLSLGLSAHHPLYDAWATALCYRDLMRRKD